jgi:[calcium/calmodulin-dependent protein kinase] kinase
MCKGKEYRGKPADVWACGVVLYYMVTKRFPFVTNNSFGQELFNKILHEDPDYSDIEDPRLILLLKGILRKDPNKRLKIEQIKKHAWTTDNGAVPIKRFNTKKIVLTDDDLKQVITNIVKV